MSNVELGLLEAKLSNSSFLRSDRDRGFINFNQNILVNIYAQEKVTIDNLRILASASENADERFDLALQSLYEGKRSKDIAARDILKANIHQELSEFISNKYQLFSDKLLPAYAEQGVRFLRASNLNTAQTVWLHDYFKEYIQPLLNPIVLDVTHPFPRIKDKNLCLFLSLKGKNAFGQRNGLVIIQIPKFIEAFVKLPDEFSDSNDQLCITIEELVKKFAFSLFYGFTVEHIYFFKVIRRRNRSANRLMKNIDLFDRKLKDDRMDDAVVRLELEERCPVSLQKLLCNTFHITVDRLYLTQMVLNLESYLLALESLLINKPSNPDAHSYKDKGWKAIAMVLLRRFSQLFFKRQIQVGNS